MIIGPISLLDGPIKILTKLLANKVQSCIMSLIHQNQYGFIKNKTIQACLSWAFQYLHMCHASKREIVCINLDFEKAFDKIEQHTIISMMHTIISMMQHKGFS